MSSMRQSCMGREALGELAGQRVVRITHPEFFFTGSYAISLTCMMDLCDCDAFTSDHRIHLAHAR